ncbi:MAG: hypothetical protein R3E84_15640, partial [Pseudomonadales bacterium]
MTLNLDDFCRDVARALIILAAVFPRPRDLFVEDVYAAEDTDEFGLHSDRYLACFNALVWLREEGFIRYTDTLRNDAVEQAVLTGRCLSTLIFPRGLAGASASIAVDENTRLRELRAALQEGSSTALRLAVMAVVGEVVGRVPHPPAAGTSAPE